MRYLYILAASMLFSACVKQEIAIRDFRVEFISNLEEGPIFSWNTDGNEQIAYQILLTENPKPLKKESGYFWDSGKKEGSFSLQHKYSGPDLVPGMKYHARVKVWTGKGNSSILSKVVSFIVPIKYPDNWQADWLTYDYEKEMPLPLFRKDFQVTDRENIDYAVFYIAAPGFYEAYLNGEKIGVNVLDPGQTNFEDYTYYTAYEVDPGELNAENTLGVMLGNGWYNQNQVWKGQSEYAPMVYGQPVFICQLVIHTKDGDRKVVGSGESWAWTQGPITYSNVYGGEHYDARREITNWNKPGPLEGEWHPAKHPAIHPVNLFEQFAEPIRVMDTLKAIDIIDRGDGTFIFDFGQNMAGWMELSLEGDPGQEISIQCTEVLNEEGDLDTRTTGYNATRVIQTQKYTCKGGGLESWEPRFTYFGYRYAKVKGLKNAPDLGLLTGHVIYSSVKEVGSFTCSEENINKLHELSKWTLIGNIHSIPTDCPHREKCGWTGDAHALIKPLIFNYDVQRFFEKYMFDMRSSGREEKEELYFGESFHDRSMVMKPAGVPTMIVPGKRTSGCATPDWGTALVQIPWYLYIYYGDLILLEDFYPDMKKWVEYVEGMKEDGIIPHGLGDWCPPGGNEYLDCPVPVSSSAFHILDVSIMEQVAGMLGKMEDQVHYAELLDQLKTDFNRHFLNPETGNYGSSQTANILSLDMDIVPQGMERNVCMAILKNIREEYEGFLNTGIFGLARVFKVLSENGYEDEVFRLLSKKGENSFAHMWDQFDVTTLWEVLPTRTEFGTGYGGSMSHPMQAGFDAWLYSGIAGINPSGMGPGFQVIEFKPYLTRQMESASATYKSKSGLISSEWRRSNTTFTWKIEIPANTKGMIYVPGYDKEGAILVNGKAIQTEAVHSGFSYIGEFYPGTYLIVAG